MQMKEKIEFVGKILDNVHGFIPYTKAEEEIMNLLLFKRLQSIKQLSLVNWVFPGSEHTRFIHSLGVMHIADKIAIQLKLPIHDRKILRLAGLLHDIGHYPLSHVCEYPYKEKMIIYSPENYCQQVNNELRTEIIDFKIKIKETFMKKSDLGHHEEIGALIIKNNIEINKIIRNECGNAAVENICDIITGNVERTPDKSILVQIMHSELDADNIDYLLRDSLFSGTSFGSFEVEQLINSMVKKEYKGKSILCIQPKGIAAADQYLINKFFSYTQVVFNKHTVVFEWMAEQIVSWMQENEYFPLKKELREDWLKKASEVSMDKFLDFTDNYFWRSIKKITEESSKTIPSFIVELSKMLLHHQELPYIDNTEYKIISNKEHEIKTLLEQSEIYKDIDCCFNDRITVLNIREITKHIPEHEYEKLLKAQKKVTDLSEEEFKKHKLQQKILRLMDGISVFDGNEIHLLCDDKRSLMQQLCKTHFVVMRSYRFSC